MLRPNLIRALQRLEIEEKILNLGSLIALIGVFMPWFGGEWFGEPTVWTGFQFYTSFVGVLVFLAHLFILSLTAMPIFGYRIMRASRSSLLRLIVSLECVLLTIVVWSVLTNVAFDRSQMEIRFGIYLTLAGSIVVSLYAFLRVQQERRRDAQGFFHHPDDSGATSGTPLPPPPAPPPEEPRLF